MKTTHHHKTSSLGDNKTRWPPLFSRVDSLLIFMAFTFPGKGGYDCIGLFQDVVRLETQYWSLVDIPKQEKQETVPAFVLRACSIMEKSQKSGEGVKTSSRLAEEADSKRERIDRLESQSNNATVRLLCLPYSTCPYGYPALDG